MIVATRLVLILSLALAACAQPPAPVRITMQDLDQVRARLFTLVQEQRLALNGQAHALTIDPQLAAAAQIHSDDMASKRSFDTGNPRGNPAVNALLSDPKFRGFVGENAAAQYITPGIALDADALAKGFVQIWLMSPNHRSNLADASFARTGIGVAVKGNMIFVAELFADASGTAVP